MIQFRHWPDRTVELDLSMADEGIWYPIPYTDLGYRLWLDHDGNVDRIEIKDAEEIDWDDEED